MGQRGGQNGHTLYILLRSQTTYTMTSCRTVKAHFHSSGDGHSWNVPRGSPGLLQRWGFAFTPVLPKEFVFCCSLPSRVSTSSDKEYTRMLCSGECADYTVCPCLLPCGDVRWVSLLCPGRYMIWALWRELPPSPCNLLSCKRSSRMNKKLLNQYLCQYCTDSREEPPTETSPSSTGVVGRCACLSGTRDAVSDLCPMW